jgi:Tfp pilus assembly protein PilO
MIQGQIPQPPDIPFDPNVVLGGHGAEVIMMIVLAAAVACTIILWPIMRAIGRRMEHKAGPDPSLKAEVEHLHQRLAEMEPLQARVAELEERIDFTERLLAQAKDPERLPR